MGKREKLKGKLDFDEENEEGAGNSSKSVVVLNSSDDEEANEDLSLKIVERSLLMRAAKLAPDDAVLDEAAFSIGGSEGALAVSTTGDSGNRKLVKKVKKKKKIKKMDIADQTVIVANEEETVKAADIVASVDANPVEITDNIVFRKLLRGPRYFDPPDSSWGACFNCGEQGHTAVKCTSVKRKKPCFVCGSLEHSAKQCSKGQDCFICKKGGHRAKDCPEKYKCGSPTLKICLKCGDSGHDMFSCGSDYTPDDLKGIQCYICKRFGHLCCVSPVDTSPRVFSCYKCGQLGHTGLSCGRVRGEAIGTGSTSTCYRCSEEGHFARQCTSSAKSCARVRVEATGTGSTSACYKCGKEGHFARQCMSSAKFGKRSLDFSTPTLRSHREEKDYSGFKSVPHDLGKVHKRRKTKYEERGITTPQKAKHRGGWITEDPGDFSHEKPINNRWRSPATPSSHKISSFTAGGHISSSQSSTRTHNFHYGTPMSQGSPMSIQHRFSASRFGNSGSSGMQRNYGWW